MKNKFLLALFLLSLFGCSTPVQGLNTTSIYKKDITFWVNGKKIKGVGVAPAADTYQISLEHPKGKIDLLAITSCHRQHQAENEGTKANYTFIPSGIEKEGRCALDVGIYDKKGRHGWGYLIFESEKNRLSARMECNGEAGLFNGSSICQSQIGTTQRISFATSVKCVTEDHCNLINNKSNVIEYEMGKNFCHYLCADSSGNTHEHISFGYETFIIRE